MDWFEINTRTAAIGMPTALRRAWLAWEAARGERPLPPAVDFDIASLLETTTDAYLMLRLANGDYEFTICHSAAAAGSSAPRPGMRASALEPDDAAIQLIVRCTECCEAGVPLFWPLDMAGEGPTAAKVARLILPFGLDCERVSHVLILLQRLA